MINWTDIWAGAATTGTFATLIYAIYRNGAGDADKALEAVKIEIKELRVAARNEIATEVKELRNDMTSLLEEMKESIDKLGDGFIQNRERIVRVETLAGIKAKEKDA